ncbi:MAG: TraE/TraK family type IV conjugative transfer system protein [bacterium]|nr:TraE/TraK family type IV conjugative transfer system protein [bacterium]
MSKITEILKDSELRRPISDNDTIRLWESHREQATLWRSLSLLQLPITFVALVFALILWGTRSITLNVPAKPLPGIYAAQDIPDSEFIDFATDYINLVATYQPGVARRQFEEGRKMLWGEMIQAFDSDMVSTELRAIENTKRTQIFFVDPTKIELSRESRSVIVTLNGERYKIIAGKEMPAVKTQFIVTITTIPKNKFNPYGLVITNVSLKNLEDK